MSRNQHPSCFYFENMFLFMYGRPGNGVQGFQMNLAAKPTRDESCDVCDSRPLVFCDGCVCMPESAVYRLNSDPRMVEPAGLLEVVGLCAVAALASVRVQRAGVKHLHVLSSTQLCRNTRSPSSHRHCGGRVFRKRLLNDNSLHNSQNSSFQVKRLFLLLDFVKYISQKYANNSPVRPMYMFFFFTTQFLIDATYTRERLIVQKYDK